MNIITLNGRTKKDLMIFKILKLLLHFEKWLGSLFWPDQDGKIMMRSVFNFRKISKHGRIFIICIRLS